MIQTGADKLWAKAEYFNAGCGMGRESTLWLIEQGVKVMGIDAWGWDRPFWVIKEEFRTYLSKFKSILMTRKSVFRKKLCYTIEMAMPITIPYQLLSNP